MEIHPESIATLLNECRSLLTCAEDEKTNASIICPELFIALITLIDITNSSSLFAESFYSFITSMNSQNLLYLDTYMIYGVLYYSTVETLPMIMNNMNYTLK